MCCSAVNRIQYRHHSLMPHAHETFCQYQGRSDGGGYIGIYTPKNQSTLQIFMWLLVVEL